MAEDALSEKLIGYLLSSFDGFEMEDLFAKLLVLRHGSQFEQLGGRKDGGADGKLRGVYSQGDGHFVQISRDGDIEKKITGTVERLREVGRHPTAVTYWTQRSVPTRDILEESLTKTLGVTVRIRDARSVLDLVNESTDSRRLFRDRFRRELDELIQQSNASEAAAISRYASDPTIYTFLKFQVIERNDRSALLAPVVDALIYWALRDTDPDQQRLLARSEVKERIAKVLPGARNILVPQIDRRLAALSTRDQGGRSRLRFYTERDAFCLPYEMRMTLAEEGAEDSQLSARVLECLRQRVSAAAPGIDVDLVARATLDVIYAHFHEQGLVLAAFLEKRLESITTEEQVLELELNRSLDSEVVSARAYRAALEGLRGFFYAPSADELRFQKLLSNTSLLLTSLNHSPQLLEYFNGMTGTFRLLMGTDILVKALSEYYLPPETQSVTNLLLAARDAGAQLILAEPVLEELVTHLHAASLEFRNHYAAEEVSLPEVIAKQSDRIFIRSYFYAKFAGKVRSWRGYIETFVDFDPINANDARAYEQIKAFILKRFGATYVSRDQLSEGVNVAERDLLAKRLKTRYPEKMKHSALAENDALMACSVYARRTKNGEAYKYDGFGLATWWLTKETKILAFTAELVRGAGTPYIMRPEFLLNFLALAPNANLSARARELLPSHVGLQLGRYLPNAQMTTLLAAVEEWRDLPKERVDVRMSEFADRLKYDQFKRYGAEVDLAGGEVFREQIAQLRADRDKEARSG